MVSSAFFSPTLPFLIGGKLLYNVVLISTVQKQSQPCENVSCSFMPGSLCSFGLHARLLCPLGFSRQEYWSGLPCPSPGDLLDPGIEPGSPALEVDSLSAELPGDLKRLWGG